MSERELQAVLDKALELGRAWNEALAAAPDGDYTEGDLERVAELVERVAELADRVARYDAKRETESPGAALEAEVARLREGQQYWSQMAERLGADLAAERAAHEQTRAESESRGRLLANAVNSVTAAEARVAELERDRAVELDVRTRFAERSEAAESALASARELLRRIVKYAREDRAQTPRATRLARALAEAETMLLAAHPATGAEKGASNDISQLERDILEAAKALRCTPVRRIENHDGSESIAAPTGSMMYGRAEVRRICEAVIRWRASLESDATPPEG